MSSTTKDQASGKPSNTIGDNWRKVVHPGTLRDRKDRPMHVFVRIEYANGRLSITGVEGPMRTGNAKGGAGQITLEDTMTLADGWTAEMVTELRRVWDRWHLNDMRAGTPAQMDYLREHRVKVTYPKSQYDQDKTTLKDAGLDPVFTEHGEPIHYGHQWLREDIPGEILEWLRGLPETTRAYPCQDSMDEHWPPRR